MRKDMRFPETGYHARFRREPHVLAVVVERYVLELSRCTTSQFVAEHLGVSWDIVKDIQKRNLRRRFAKPKLKKVLQIAIDEICIGRSRRFLTGLSG
jgi:hypothetical protein